MNLANLIPGVSGFRLAADVIGLVAICYAGYDLVYKPIEARGEKIGYSHGVEEQKKETDKALTSLKEANETIAKMKKDSDDALVSLAQASNDQLEKMAAAKTVAERKSAAILADYNKLRSQKIEDIIKTKGGEYLPTKGQPYFAPIETAGLSRPGVDTVNALIQQTP